MPKLTAKMLAAARRGWNDGQFGNLPNPPADTHEGRAYSHGFKEGLNAPVGAPCPFEEKS